MWIIFIYLLLFFSFRAFKLTIDDGLQYGTIYIDMTNQTHHESNLLSLENNDEPVKRLSEIGSITFKRFLWDAVCGNN